MAAVSLDTLREKARIIQKEIVESTTAAGSGHPSSSLSAVQLLLFYGPMLSIVRRVRELTRAVETPPVLMWFSIVPPHAVIAPEGQMGTHCEGPLQK